MIRFIYCDQKVACRAFWTGLAVICLVAVLFPYDGGAAEPKKFSSYIERFPQGSIDWDNGMIYGYGKAYTDAYGDRKQALSAARSMASSSIVKLAAGVRLNDELFMKSLGKGRVAIRIEAFVKYKYEQKKLVTNTKRAFYEVIRMTPVKGVEGLTAKLIDHFKTAPVPWMKPPKNPLISRLKMMICPGWFWMPDILQKRNRLNRLFSRRSWPQTARPSTHRPMFLKRR